MNRHKSAARTAMLAVALAVAMGGAACSKGSSATTTPPPTPGARPSSTAHLSLLSPTNGQVIHGSTIPLRIDLTGATIVPATTRHIVPDQGHIHVYLDNHIVAMNFSLTEAIPNVPPGTHFVRVEFVASDHLPFNPDVATPNVTFLVQP
jgi:hypothetical protein